MMHIGVAIFPTDTTLQPIELARAVEERGFESLWFPEHSHIPVSRETPWGGVKGADPLPEMYWRTHDAFVALAAAAAVTNTIKLGTGITLVAQRDPLWLAKQVASLDVISNGRVQFGVGYGWNKEEMANHGLAYPERRAILRENVLAMIELWTKDEAEFHGEHVDITPSWAWPKPIQKPHPPIHLGGAAGPRTMSDIVEFCNGWMPIVARHDVAGKIVEVREAIEAAGRDPDSLELTAWQAPRDLDRLAMMRDLGITRAVFGLPSAEPEIVIEKLDKYAGFAAALNA
jgi:probable F420-dependent oxidoreductase